MYDRRDRIAADEPPNSRLFIIAQKTLAEEDLKKSFQEFGKIEEVWGVKDRVSGEKKGVFYIKYSKTSEAARAMEAMNGTNLGGRALKVMIAASRDQGSRRDDTDEDTISRLFVLVPKTMDDSELFDYFSQFGEIDYASVIKDRNTGESKGVAFVKYYKFSDAAIAFEDCDRKYKPKFADPKKPREEREMPPSMMHAPSPMYGHREGPPPVRNGGGGGFSSGPAPQAPDGFDDEGFKKLVVLASPQVNQDQMWKLFDIVPTMDYCQVNYEGDPSRPSKASAEVVYTDARWASYAKDKYHGFEYPPGFRLIVKPEYEAYGSRGQGLGGQATPEILKIAETIAQATNLIKAAGLSPDILTSKLGLSSGSRATEDQHFCSVPLPPPQSLTEGKEMRARCFIVCFPTPLPNHVLTDVFSRFGCLIEAYMLGRKNCGYARYASVDSAKEAIKTLHGAEVMGIRLKVIEAEERTDRKRQRLDDEEMKDIA